MMERIVGPVVGVLLVYTQIASATTTCGDIFRKTTCYGDDAYCCRKDDGSMGCCWEAYIYELWWFWLIWIIMFFLILACALACWRRRRARYGVMVNSQYPAYGTVAQTTNTGYMVQPGYNPPYPSAPTQYSNVPVAPPSYETAQATKPPAYSN